MNPTPPSSPEIVDISPEITPETPRDILSKAIDEYADLFFTKAIDEYVDPFFKEYGTAVSDGIYIKDKRGGPMDTAMGGLGTAGPRNRASLRLARSTRTYEKAVALKFSLLNLAEEYDTPMESASLQAKFGFRIRFLKVLFSLPTGDSRAATNLRAAFEAFLKERKKINLSHF